MADAIQSHEPLVLGEQNLLDVLTNLCVAYAVSDQNGLAGTLVGKLTEEEAPRAKEDQVSSCAIS